MGRNNVTHEIILATNIFNPIK